MRFGFCAGSYTDRSTAVADEELINFFTSTVETQGAVAPAKAYGGATAQGGKALYYTPGLSVFATLSESPVRGQWHVNGRSFAVGGTQFVEVNSDGTTTSRGVVASDGGAVSFSASLTQVLLVSASHAYCFALATNTFTEVTGLLQGTPVQVEYSDTYFIISGFSTVTEPVSGQVTKTTFFQMSSPLDGTVWPPLQVNEISVFPDGIRSIIVNHRELIVAGSRHAQPYGDTGSDNVFDVIQGTMIEQGSAATFGPCKLDNSIFWIGEDDRGSRMAWRANGYTPVRVSTHAVEYDLTTYSTTQIAGLVSYAYQDAGHTFWVLYIPNSTFSWVYDVAEGLWHKRSSWNASTSTWGPHWSWNHVYSFGKHLVGDWNSANIYELSMAYLDDAGTAIRRVRRSPTISNEMEWIYLTKVTFDIDTGQGPVVALTDGAGNPRAPQALVRISRNRGKTWGNEHTIDCGQIGEYGTRAILWRCGRFRYGVIEFSVTDPVPWVVVDAYIGDEGAE